MASVSEKLQNLIDSIETTTQDEFENLTDAIQALKDEQFGGEYKIYNEKDLRKFAELVNSGRTHLNAKLMNDIGDSENLIDWTDLGIGTNESPYQGTFDGQEFSIWLKFHTTSDNGYREGRYFGLFHNIKNAFIKNLTLEGSFTTACTNVPGSPNTTEKTGMQIGCLAVNAYISKIHKCFNKININLQNPQDETKGLIVYACAGLITNCYGTHIYQCGNYGNITLTKLTTTSTVAKSLRGYGGGLIYKCKTYQLNTWRIEECFNKGSIFNIIYGGGIVAKIAGEALSNNSIELINDAKIPLPLTLFGYPDNLQTTVDLDSLIVNHSDNIIVEKFKVSQTTQDKNQFIIISTDKIEDNGFISINGIQKNVKIIPIEKSTSISLIKNCYNTGNYGAYINKFNYSSGVVGALAELDTYNNPFIYITNCYDAGNPFFNKNSNNNYAGYTYGSFILNKRYHQMGLLKNCYTLYISNNAELTDMTNAIETSSGRAWYREVIFSQYPALMEHPHFCDMLDNNVFISNDQYPCFKWEEDKIIDLNTMYKTTSAQYDNLYMENLYSLPSNLLRTGVFQVKNNIKFNSISNFVSETFNDTQSKKIILQNLRIMNNNCFNYLYTENSILDIHKDPEAFFRLHPGYFNNCLGLTYFILRNAKEEIALTKAFPVEDVIFNNGKLRIYVPYVLLETYKTASNWSTFAPEGGFSRIRSIEGIIHDSDGNEIFNDLEEEETLEQRLTITGGFTI